MHPIFCCADRTTPSPALLPLACMGWFILLAISEVRQTLCYGVNKVLP
uniref:Uncharacterized protein n=1 Tax=Rhizophora mucronata TaxID=61149 RepID=A0A2P2P8T9_RHIMU